MPRKAGLDQAQVVHAAAQLINAEGVEALSINRLAERLGVQPPSLYNHIQGLPGLYRDLALLNHRSLRECLANAVIGKSGPHALVAMAEAYRAFIKEYPGLYAVSLRAARNRAQPDPELEQAEERVVQVVLAVIASFGLEGEDAIHAVRGLRSLVHGFATLEMAEGFGLPLDCDESFRRLVDLLLRGLTQPDLKGASR